MKPKTYFILSFFIVFVFVSGRTFAQYRGMGAVRAASNLRMMNQMAALRNVGMNVYSSSPDEYDFQVTMSDSTKKEVISGIYTDKNTKRKFILLEDKSYKRSDTNRYKKIFPSQTLSIVEKFTEAAITSNDTAVVKYAYGRPADSCWMFNIKAGTISLLSYRCDGWDNQDSPRTIVGIQLAGDPPVQFTPENLEKMIAGDERAMKYFKKKIYFDAIERFNKDAEKAGR